MKCRIISVNPENIGFNSTQNFGHKINSRGEKQRYISRRDKINTFIEDLSIDNLDIDIFDAITPNNFKITDNKVLFEDKILPLLDNTEFYVANNLSHYKIWEMEEDTLILEDDLIWDKTKFNNIIALIDNFKTLNLNNSILYLQISAPWDESASEKHLVYKQILNENLGYADSIDFSGTAAYFLTKECKKIILNNMQGLCACDRYLDNLRKNGIIKYCIPTNKNNMFCLDTETMWL